MMYVLFVFLLMVSNVCCMFVIFLFLFLFIRGGVIFGVGWKVFG